MAQPSNAVFISYRREASWTLVEALYQRLSAADIDAFYDIESIRAGEFEQVILNQIRARPYFVLVLTPGTLERCSEGDWLRREIETAVAFKRMIVPVYTPAFDLSTLEDALPGGLGRKVAGYQAVELPHKYFKFAVQQLAEEYLVPRETEVLATPSQDQIDVTKIQLAAAAAPPVSQDRLTAQQCLETAYDKAVHRRDFDSALSDLDEAIRLDPAYADAFSSRGGVRHAAGDFDSAMSDLDEAIRLDPSLATAFATRGAVHYGKGDFDSALSDLDHAIRLDPSLASAYSNRGAVHYDKGDVNSALSDLDHAIRLNRTHVAAYRNRAAIRYAKRAFDLALADYDEAIRLDPTVAAAFIGRGVTHHALGNLPAAISDLDEAIRLDPDDPAAIQNREAIAP